MSVVYEVIVSCRTCGNSFHFCLSANNNEQSVLGEMLKYVRTRDKLVAVCDICNEIGGFMIEDITDFRIKDGSVFRTVSGNLYRTWFNSSLVETKVLFLDQRDIVS